MFVAVILANLRSAHLMMSSRGEGLLANNAEPDCRKLGFRRSRLALSSMRSKLRSYIQHGLVMRKTVENQVYM